MTRHEPPTPETDLQQWRQDQPDNYFECDAVLAGMLSHLLGPQSYKTQRPGLARFGAVAAKDLDHLIAVLDNSRNLPVLTPRGRFGERIEEVTYAPAYHEAGRIVRASGVLSAYAHPHSNLVAASLLYLAAHHGEAGHICAIACTIGLIKAIAGVGDDTLRDAYLKPLRDPDYDRGMHGAQYLTEIQGGSDVGSNTCQATRDDAGQWRLTGRKWFCSNVSANLALVTARATHAPGTKGLGLFVVPRHLPTGEMNSMYIDRLKDKLGTRSLATGEVTFDEALCYQLGEPERGFANVMKYAITTSRLFDCVLACGASRRAFIIASSFARHRRAFGQPIDTYPLVQQALLEIWTTSEAILAGTLHLAHLQDRLEEGQSDSQEKVFFRVMLGLLKVFTSTAATRCVLRAMECLGGNGTIHDFSVLPRLLQDCMVYENWEGTHNTLLMQGIHDLRHDDAVEMFFSYLRAMSSAVGPSLRGLDPASWPRLKDMQERLIRELRKSDGELSLFFRPFAAELAREYCCLALLLPDTSVFSPSDASAVDDRRRYYWTTRVPVSELPQASTDELRRLTRQRP